MNCTGPKCRLCRLEGTKLFLKGKRCEGEMCAVTRRQTLPGMHAKQHSRSSEYGAQLREKQKVKRLYGITETQFKKYYEQALKAKSNTGELLLSLLEQRLDNVCYRLGWGLSRFNARQLISQGKIQINDRKVSTPSFTVKKGDTVKYQGSTNFLAEVTQLPKWIKQTKKGDLKAEIVDLPKRSDVSVDINEQMIIEFYSR